MNAIFQCLAEVASSLRNSSNQLLKKEGRNFKDLLALLKVVHTTEGKIIHPVQVRQSVKDSDSDRRKKL